VRLGHDSLDVSETIMRNTGIALGLAALLALSACDAAEIGPQAPNRTDGKTSVFLTEPLPL
jgi:hypothetical protein